MASPLRPILRKKKSVTFHPSTKASSAANTPIADTGEWDTPSRPVASTAPSASATGADGPRRRAPRGRKNGSPATHQRSSERLLKDSSRPGDHLLEYNELPAWQQDNPLIPTSYRPISGSHAGSIPSLFQLHNETCNVWTHLAGLIFFSIFGAYLLLNLSTMFPKSTDGDWYALLAFFAGVCICYTASASYHLFSNVGQWQARVWNGVDYAGIVACIWGSFIACLHFGFPDDAGGVTDSKYVRLGADGEVVDVGRRRRRGYEGMISVLGLVCTTISVIPRFRTAAWRPFRALMFVLMGLSAAAPVVHGLILYGRARLEQQMSLSWVVLQGALYIIGAALYAARIPERFAPGKFDVIGASHQIFHLLIVLAALSHLVGLLKALKYACSLR